MGLNNISLILPHLFSPPIFYLIRMDIAYDSRVDDERFKIIARVRKALIGTGCLRVDYYNSTDSQAVADKVIALQDGDLAFRSFGDLDGGKSGEVILGTQVISQTLSDLYGSAPNFK